MIETVYTPRTGSSTGGSVWHEMFLELWRGRELTWRLFLRDFSVRYRQSVFGYLWALFPVILTTVTFTWLTRSRMLTIVGTPLPYPVFVLLSMTVWQLFSTGLTGATQSLVSAGTLLAKINFPRESLVLAAFGQSVVEFAIRAVLVGGAMLIYHVAPPWTAVLIPLAVLPLCLFTLGLGFITSLLNGVIRDVGQMITLVLTFWMFLTPVVYPAATRGTLVRLTALNPVAPFVIAAQDLAGIGRLTQPGSYVFACLVSAIVFFLGWRLFHLSEARIAERT